MTAIRQSGSDVATSTIKALPTLMKSPEIRRTHPEVLFFGESPGAEEARQGRAFVGPCGKLMERLVSGLLPDRVCLFDNVCPEFLNGDKPNKAKLDEYQAYRLNRIKEVKPEVVVLLGAHAFKAFGLKHKPTESCGKVETVDGIPMVLSVHPSYVLRDPNELHLYRPVFAAVDEILKKKKYKHPDVQLLHTLPEVTAWLKKRERTLCSVDLETSSLDSNTGTILCAGISDGKSTVCLPFSFKEFLLDRWHTGTAMRSLFRKWWSKGPRIVHNSRFEMAWLGGSNPVTDTMMNAYLLDSSQPKGLDALINRMLDVDPYWINIDPANLAQHSMTDVCTYCGLDALYTYRINTIQHKRMTPEQIKASDKLLVPIIRLILQMERTGVKVDLKRLKDVTTRIKKLTSLRMNAAQKEFPDVNFRSPEQMRTLLFEKLKLPPIERTRSSKTHPSGQWSTKSDVLAKLAKQEPRLRALAEARKLQSLRSRVLEPWLEAVDHEGLIHSTFAVGYTSTGRLSSSNPNMQNLDRPSKVIKWKGIQRTCLTSRFKSGSIVQFDYAQHELRIQAAVANDTFFLDCIRKGQDAHQLTADQLQCERSTAKNINFSLIYLITADGLFRKYGIPLKAAEKLREDWYKLHPAITRFHNAVEKSIKEKGYVENIFGWRRIIADPGDSHQYRVACNFPIQSAAVILCFLAMLDIQRWLEQQCLDSRIILQVHDSIVLDCPKKEVKLVQRTVPKIMVGMNLKPWVGNRLHQPIPLGVDVKTGPHL